MTEKTILKLYPNGNIEVLDATLTQSGILGQYKFSENEIRVPSYYKYGSTNLLTPIWAQEAQDTGNPISFFPGGILYKGDLILPTNGVVVDGLRAYYHARNGLSGTLWTNIAVRRGNSAILNNMVTDVNEGLLRTTKQWGSYVSLTLPTEVMATTPFTLETRLSVSDLTDGVLLFTGYGLSSIYGEGFMSTDGIYIELPNETLSNTVSLWGGKLLSPNTFYTFSIVYDGNYALSLYIDGQLIRTITTTERVRLNSHSLLEFGEDINAITTYKFIRLYSKALSSEEILKNYNVGDGVGL